MADFRDLEGLTLVYITGKEGDDVLRFVTDTGVTYLLLHEQDCCECVTVEDICGDFSDLLNTPIIQASEETNDDNWCTWDNTDDATNMRILAKVVLSPEDEVDYEGSTMWTFYRLRTIKGTVTIRWYGSSNGWYSVSVYFRKEE